MSQLFIHIIGHNASGKTTIGKKLATSLNLNRVAGDDFRNFVSSHVPYFEDFDISYPTPKGAELNPLVVHYRLELSQILVKASQSVIFEGSGLERGHRQKILQIADKMPDIKTVIIWVDIPEPELVERLSARDQGNTTKWIPMYYEFKKKLFEVPANDEADVLLRYDQNNYEEVEQKIKDLME